MMDRLMAQSALLYGRAKAEKWAEEFERKWYKPESDLMLRMLWEQFTPEDIAALKEQHPDQMEAFETYLDNQGGK